MSGRYRGKPPKPKQPRLQRDPKNLHLHYEWIEKIVCFDLKNNVHLEDPTVWMTERQNEAFKAFQKQVRQMARSGEWGDYATVEVEPELYGIIEDILGITFADGAETACYNCGVEFPDRESLDSHEETCGV